MFGLSRKAAAPSHLSDRSRRAGRITRRLLCVWTIIVSVPGFPDRASAQEIPSAPFDQTEAAAKKTKGKIGPGVEEALAAEGSARVIVALQPPGSLKRPARSRFGEIRRDVENAQNAAIGVLTPNEHTLHRKFKLVPGFAATIRSQKDLDRLAGHPLVVRVDIDEKATIDLDQSVPLIRADSMHAHGYTGNGVVVAVLDTGIDTDHPDLADDLIHEECFLSSPYCPNGLARQSGPGSAEDDAGHGTHVSGTITSPGIVSSVGVAPDAEIVAVKILNSDGWGWNSDVVAGLDWVLNNRPDVDLINMSLGGGLYSAECDFANSSALAFSAVINALRYVGVTTFASAGNNSSSTHMGLPGCISGVVSVGATDDYDQVAWFSNTNIYTDLLAPGVGIVADIPGGGVESMSGTSMASPHAAGCAALQLEAGRATTPGTVESWLKTSGVPVTDARNGLTFPRIDCFAEPNHTASSDLLAAVGAPDGAGVCGGSGAYTINVSGGTISRTSDTDFKHVAVGNTCWSFSSQYTRLYLTANDPATFDHWESPSGHAYLLDGHNGTSSTTIETSLNLLGQSPTFLAVHVGGAPTPDLFGVGKLSGAGAFIGTLSGGSSTVYPAIAIHPTTKLAYVGGGNGVAVLHSLNTSTGAVTPIGSAGSGVTRIGAMDFRSDGTLFASVKVGTSGGAGADYLATINPTTGAATLIGSFDTCNPRCGIEGMEALAFDASGVLYGALHERAPNGTPGLYTINTTSGVATFVAPILDGSSNPASGGITSLEFNDGVLYGGTAASKTPPGDGGKLVGINKATGVFVPIGAPSATGGRGILDLAIGAPMVSPANDDLADAITVGSLPFGGTIDNHYATSEPSEAFGSCSSDHGNSIWWSFTGTASERIEINTNGSGVNTGLSIWTGSSHSLTEIACDDDSGTGVSSRILFNATAGTQYFVRVVGLAGQEGSTHLNVLVPVLPANDDLAGSIPLGAFPSTKSGTNLHATRETMEQSASCAPDVGNAVWWHFTTSSNEAVVVDTKGSNFDTVLGIWTGSDHPLTQVACDDDAGGLGTSEISFNAAAGETYRIRVSGFGEAEGSIVLNSDVIPGVGCDAQAQIPIPECEALMAFYDSTNGFGWTNYSGWGLTSTPCSWYGVTCSGGHVVGIYSEANNLVGELPESLGNLDSLRSLQLSYNTTLAGPIPQSLGSLTKLESIYLFGNGLTGSIPESIGSLQNLYLLSFGYNALTGSIPASLGDLDHLTQLDLAGNQLTGPIPEALATMSSLNSLYLFDNGLTGSIPASLGNMSNMRDLLLDHNDLTGLIPASLGNLSDLRTLALGNNSLTGSIPSELGSLSNLDHLYLNDNNLTGSIPVQLGNMSNMVQMYLQNNGLTGLIPAEFGNLSKLKSLWLDNNDLTGPIPESLGGLTELLELRLAGNSFSGTIPPSLGGLSKVRTFALSDNNLTGSIPETLGGLGGTGTIYYVFLDHNNFQSIVPLPVATRAMQAEECDFTANHASLCVPDTPDYQAVASGGAICGLPLDPNCTALPPEIVYEPGDGYSLSWTLDPRSDEGLFSHGNSAYGARSVLVGMDFDDDGNKEILFTTDETLAPGGPDPGFLDVFLYENNGNDSYEYVWHYTHPTGSNSLPALAYGDLDKDGLWEIYFGIPTIDPDPGDLFVFEQNEDGSFPETPTTTWDYGKDSALDFRPAAFAIADVDGDGQEELVTGSRTSGARQIVVGSPNGAIDASTVWTNEFEAGEDVLGGGAIYDVDVADFDNDGMMEIWVNTWDLFSFAIFEATGADSYELQADINQAYPAFDHGSFNSHKLLFHDMDDDGRIELVVPTTNGYLFYLDDVDDVSTITGPSFVEVGSFMEVGDGTETRGADIGDIDGDGNVDIVVSLGRGEKVINLEYQGGGPGDLGNYERSTVLAQTTVETTNRFYPLRIADDLDKDGKKEIVITNLYASQEGEKMILIAESDSYSDPDLHVEAKVFLEGSYGSSGMVANPNFTAHLPSAQPYSASIFDGTALDHDNPDVVSSAPESALDWVLVSLRSDIIPTSEVPGSQRTAFLLEDGSIVDTTGGTLAFPGVARDGYYLVVRHRNHTSVMSSDTLDLSDGYGSWDFTTAMSQAYSANGNPMKDLGDGKFGMFACDASADGLITVPDFNLWNAATSAGASGYEQADCNMDGFVTVADFNSWNANTTAGASSKVPD